MNEFTPIKSFYQVIHFWWLVAAAVFVGGLVGFLFYRVRPPLYEATAVFYVTIDANKMPKLETPEQYQYTEDISVEALKAVLISDGVKQAVVQKAAAQNIQMDTRTLLQNSAIERQHGLWQLRVRSTDPAAAQSLVNIWAEQGYQTMLAWQKAGQIAVYVNFVPPSLADLPNAPVTYKQNYVILSGAFIGFIAAIFLSGLWGKRQP